MVCGFWLGLGLGVAGARGVCVCVFPGSVVWLTLALQLQLQVAAAACRVTPSMKGQTSSRPGASASICTGAKTKLEGGDRRRRSSEG